MAFAINALISSSDRTGPFNVTVPFWLMILMLCAYVERDLSSMTALRIFAVRSRSAAFIFWLSAVTSAAFLSRSFVFELSAFGVLS